MKKLSLIICVMVSFFVLASCSPSPEDLYLQELETKMPKVEELGTSMEDVGTQMEQEKFIEVVKGLAILKNQAKAVKMASYTGEDTDLKKVSSEFNQSILKIAELVTTLQPLADKAALNPEAPMTNEDEVSQTKALDLMNQIDTHFTEASEAFDEYTKKNQ